MARTKQGKRKNVGRMAHHMRQSVWHPALTTAAELGEEHLEAALEAEVELHGRIQYEVGPSASCPHSGSRLPDGSAAAEVPASPFPPHSSFGILAYAVWHGHHAVVEAYLQELGVAVNGAAVVPTEPQLQVQHHPYAHHNIPGRATVVDTMPATALQIAVWKRDTRMVKLLRMFHVDEELPFLLDMAPPRAGTLFATKAGEWSSEGHWCFPHAFKAAVRELLLISHKYGGERRRDGQLRWGFNTGELQDLLLPAMGRGTMTAWVKLGDRLPEDSGDAEASSEAGGSQDGGSEDEE